MTMTLLEQLLPIVVDLWACWALPAVNVGTVCFFAWFPWLSGTSHSLIGMNWKRLKLMLNLFTWGLILFEVCIVSSMSTAWGAFLNFWNCKLTIFNEEYIAFKKASDKFRKSSANYLKHFNIFTEDLRIVSWWHWKCCLILLFWGTYALPNLWL